MFARENEREKIEVLPGQGGLFAFDREDDRDDLEERIFGLARERAGRVVAQPQQKPATKPATPALVSTPTAWRPEPVKLAPVASVPVPKVNIVQEKVVDGKHKGEVLPVDTIARERVSQLDEQATALGFPPQEKWYGNGTVLLESGKQRFQASRKAWDLMDWSNSECSKLKNRIRDENRTDYRRTVGDLHMQDDGQLDLGGFALPVEEPAFGGLCQRIGIPYGNKYLASCPPDLRAQNVNHWLRSVDQEKELQLRVRHLQRSDNERTIFAAVGKAYTPMDLDEIAEIAQFALPGDAKGTVRYDGRRGSIQAIFHAPVDFPAAVGDYYKAGIEICSDDTGAGALVVKALLWQAICRNLTTVCRGIDVLRKVHKGRANSLGLGEALRAAIREAEQKIVAFRDSWIDATAAVVQGAGLDLEPAFAKLVQQKVIEAPVDDEELVRRLRGAYWKAPEANVKGIANAVTRMAHETSWSSPWQADALQDQAGDLIRGAHRIAKVGSDALTEAKAGGWTPGRWSLEQAQNGVVNAQPVFLFAT